MPDIINNASAPSCSKDDEESPGKKGFCAVLVNGNVQCNESDNLDDLCPLLEKASLSWIDYVVDDFENDVVKLALELGFSEHLTKRFLSKNSGHYEDFVNELGILIPAIRVEGFDVMLSPLLILMRENVLVTLHTSETTRFFRVRRYAETLIKKLPERMLQTDKMTLLLIRLIDENNGRNFDHLRDIEEQGDELSRILSDTKTPRDIIGKDIYKMKHALIEYLSGLWSTVDALNSVHHGDADLLTDDPKILDRMSGLVDDVHSQIGLAEHLSEVLASGLEVLQSIYNNQLQILNNRLAMLVGYLTIIGTALLVPNTIATVTGNSMFEFAPSDIPWYIGMIIGSTILATVVAWWVLKKINMLPKSPE
ncbi:MAG: magnesium transporter CorA [Candidatus Aenigmarchaeota archaeon]|nr:magnesium transporter CorA [Candidatus Aenigmarchaeota archaeon]